MIVEPLEAKADSYEVNRLAEDFSSLRFERVVEAEGGDPAKYEIPKKELTLWYKNKPEPVKLLFGLENPIDQTIFARKEGDPRIVLLASYLKSPLDKKVFDFRQKDIFKFETDEVAGLKLKAKDIVWEARKKEGEWFFQGKPSILAKKSRLEDLLRSLSGVRAKEFITEAKTPQEMEQCGLHKSDYSAVLFFPARDQETTFSLHKDGEKVYVTTSLSPKIIVAETQVIQDLEKKVDDLREKAVVVFNSWQATRVEIKKGALILQASKNAEDKWLIEDESKEADRSKIETFVRKIESLEGTEFIDAPAGLEEYGLAPPQAEVTVWTKSEDKEQSFQIFFGNEEPEKKLVVVRNPKLDYLFRVDASVLAEFPKEKSDWNLPPPEKAEEKKEEKKGDKP